MSQRDPIPADTLESQARASDPQTSAWVSANAGSGKTHVLAQRVIRLLLAGTDPAKILCLTYTRAAAANMSNRVFGNLAGWSLLPDEALADAVAAIEGRRPDAAILKRARRLFARALETPGGLKIQTIHAFCEAILHQFPLEANIAGHFELLDQQMEAAILAEARRDLLTGATVGPDRTLGAAFADILEEGGESGLDQLIGEILAHRDGLRRLIDAIGNDPVPYQALFEEFGFSGGEGAAQVANACWPLPGFSQSEFDALAAAAAETDARSVIKQILPGATRAFAEADPARRLELMAGALLSGKGEAYAATTFKKALCEHLPGIYERYLAAVAVLGPAVDRLRLMRMLEATRSAYVIADRLIARYEHLKRARGFLDFSDLISRTINLLSRADAGPWVQYKLDRGIDHILIDEAQDTSPDQWRIVRMLAEEFFSGFGSRGDVTRTIFAVGDEKQSIYSFQGAEPAAFIDNRSLYQARVPEAGGRFERVRLRHSFRSTQDVLSAVDRVFSSAEARDGLTRDPEPIEHEAIRAAAPGYVELWSSLSPEIVEEPDDWTESVDHASAPAVKLAETIAATIQSWLDGGETIEGKGRRLRPGDIMVLVRKRDRFVHALSRSLKNRHIAVAGADRLRLTAHIAVKDLLALGRFIMQPADDLSLAALLRSPLFDLSEEQLFSIAHCRGRAVALYDALRAGAADDPDLSRIVGHLEAWRNEAAFRPVFDFYAGVLAARAHDEGARRQFVARLGHEAEDVLDEFLTFCLAFEKTGPAGLEALLAALDGAAPEIKREMDQTRDEVRIMTVHAAKGLEAPVVFLVDPGSAPFSGSHLPRLIPFEPRSEHWRTRGYLWRAGKALSNGVSQGLEAEARRKGEQEYRRLLYVGMTRAEDRLVVCGYHGVRGRSDETWHAMVQRALDGASATSESAVPDICRPVLRFRVTPHGDVRTDEAQTGLRIPEPLPAALTRPAPPAPLLPRPLAPSGASAMIEPPYEPVSPTRSPVLQQPAAPAFAIERGLVIHRLLQTLPDIPAGKREAAATRYLAHAGASWPEAERESAWESVSAILAEATFAPLFAPGSRAEISVMGTLDLGARTHVVSGKIDRLAVTDDAILIVDYKTNRPAPETIAEVPGAYVAQIALYCALLSLLYPGRRVEAALLFTEVPTLVRIPAQAREEALARLRAS